MCVDTLIYINISIIIYMTQINISLPDDLIEQVKSHARDNGKTFSGMVRIGLKKQLFKGASK